MARQNEKVLNLLEQNGRSLYTLMVRLTLSEDTAQDLLQELFLKLAASDIDAVSNLSAYAYRTAVNLAFDWRRKKTGQKIMLAEMPRSAADDNFPLNSLIRKEELEQILNAVESLNGLSREIFVIHYIQQVSYKNIATAFEKTEDQVRAICCKGVEKIRLLLSPNADDFCRKEANDG